MISQAGKGPARGKAIVSIPSSKAITSSTCFLIETLNAAAVGWFPPYLGLGLVVKDGPTELSCVQHIIRSF